MKIQNRFLVTTALQLLLDGDTALEGFEDTDVEVLLDNMTNFVEEDEQFDAEEIALMVFALEDMYDMPMTESAKITIEDTLFQFNKSSAGDLRIARLMATAGYTKVLVNVNGSPKEVWVSRE